MFENRNPPGRPAPVPDFRSVLKDLGYEGSEVVGALLETSPDYVALVDFEGIIRCVNERSTVLLGWTPEEMVGCDARDFIAAEEHPLVAATVERLRSGESLPVYERTYIDRSGNRRMGEISAAVIRDRNSEPLAVLSTVRDVTERRRAEVFLRRLVEGASAAVGPDYLDSLASTLVQVFKVKAAGVLRTGGSHTEPLRGSYVVREQLSAVYPVEASRTPHHAVTEDRAVQIERNARSLYPDDPELERLGIESYTGLPLTGRDGALRGVLFMMDDRPGSIDTGHWGLRTFSERAVLEIEHFEQRRWLEREERRRRRLLRHVPAVLYERVPDPTKAADFLGSEFAHLGGFEGVEWDRPFDEFLEFVDERDRERLRITVKAALEARLPYRVEFRLVGSRGETRWIRDEATPMGDEDGDLFVGVLLDVTSQRAAQEQVANTRRLESIGFLAAGVAHDFNNLLMTCIGQISLAKSDLEAAPEAAARLDEIESTLTRAAGLTRQLQSLAKGGEAIRKPCDLRELVRRTASFATQGTEIETRFEFADDLWPCLADEGQVAQVVENLVLNAAQAMPTGGELVIRADNEELDAVGALPLKVGRYVRCRVTDCGRGIEPSLLDKIFDPYFSTREKGFGLGLASSYAILRRHGGHIVAESSPGAGTTMTFYLMASDKPLEDWQSGPVPDLGVDRRALVLDDEPDVLSVVGRMLKNLGHEVVTARTGEEAIERVRAETEAGRPLDFALLDLTIRDGLSGRQAAWEIRKIAPDLPLIATSGYSDESARSSLSDYGFNDNLAKPYTLKQLRKMIDRL